VLSRSRFAFIRPHRPSVAGLAVATGSLVVATGLAAVVHLQLGISDAAIVYMLAVVAVGMGYGSWMAVATSVASFLLYDFFFVQPLYTFSIAAPEEWLDLLLFLFVAIVIGRLSALQLQRRREADLRSSEARAMFAMSRDIATAASALEAAPLLASRLAREAEMARVWIGLGPAIPEERVVADTASGEPRPSHVSRWTLHATTADGQPSWAHVRELTVIRRDGGAVGREDRLREARLRGPEDDPLRVLRVPISVGGETIGSLWATRPRGAPFPGRSHSRLMAAAADQLGQSVVRDRLAAEATAVEVARQGDALKSALLDSVSHDLRTPLAAIRASAGNLMDPAVAIEPDEQRAVARSIDVEAERLSRLVRNMLDLGRIEGGALHPSPELYDLADLIDPVAERIAPLMAPGQVELRVPDDLPAVQVDGIFVDQILTNLLENAARYAAGKQIVVSAKTVAGQVWLVVEDAGPGVSATALPHIFERFYRAPRGQGSRSGGGSGIGLAVVKGLAEAMGGSALARTSSLGGLEVIVRLPIEPESNAEPVLETAVLPEVENEPAAEGAAEPEVAAEPALSPEPEAGLAPAAEPATEPAEPAVDLPVAPSVAAVPADPE
jgi:two-component system, OmpR family, sensor histidine kinase KdpD